MKLDPARHPWLTAPETQTLMAALGDARFVGGVVRNALLGEKVGDIDIAVPMAPDETMRRLGEAAIKYIPTGIEHGTVTAVLSGKPFEITSLRRDVETDGRHAVVAYTSDWREDSLRRDFTMNALYAGKDGEIYDYHDGIDDLLAGRVRFVGDPASRIREDYLRILRLFRFHAWYGKGDMDQAALRAAADAKKNLGRLSGERIAKELLRLLECTNPIPALRLMAASAILTELLPYALHLGRLERLVEIDTENHFAPDSCLRLSALLPDDGQVALMVGERLKLSNAERARLEALAKMEKQSPPSSAQEVRRRLYRVGPERFRDGLLLSWAGSPKAPLPWRMLLAITDSWERPRFPLTGRDVMAEGVPEGPEVGRVLDQLEDWWLEQDFVPDHAALMERLKTIIGPGRAS